MSASGSGDGDGNSHQSRNWSQQVSSEQENVGVAAGGRDRSRGLTDDENRILSQARYLLDNFVMDSAERENMSQDHCNLLRQAIQEYQQEEEVPSSDDLTDVALSFRKIGDEVNEKIERDANINRLIANVPPGSQYEVFEKVCSQMFQDRQFNWGRIVVLFFFAYKLISKAVTTTKDCIEWVKRILKLAIDYFAQYFVIWVVQRGGWKMILEYWGTSRKTFFALVLTSLATGLYYYFK